jgi:hypothetical protein
MFSVKISEIQTAAEQQRYHHGFSDSEVEEITVKFKDLQDKLEKKNIIPSLEEFKTIIVPHCRIKRTEAFNLQPVKEVKARKEKVIEYDENGNEIVKTKLAKPPKEKVVKVKKLTQKEIKTRVNSLIFKHATEGLTVEELEELKQLSPDIDLG